jgi:hypothetical protein
VSGGTTSGSHGEAGFSAPSPGRGMVIAIAMTKAEQRREVLERARLRRRRRSEERAQEPLRRAMLVGGAIGLIVGALVGAALWADAFLAPTVCSLGGLALGIALGASPVLYRAHMAERRRQGGATEPVVASVSPTPDPLAAGGDPDEYLVPPGYYPDPRGGSGRRFWNGLAWTAEVR